MVNEIIQQIQAIDTIKLAIILAFIIAVIILFKQTITLWLHKKFDLNDLENYAKFYSKNPHIKPKQWSNKYRNV